MGDKEDTQKIGCGVPLGTSGYIKWFCGRPRFLLCGGCEQRRDADPNAWTCPGCGYQIVEGQHFMELPVRIGTRMPEDWQPVVEVPDITMSFKVHGPTCAALCFNKDDVIKDVFG